MSLKWRLRALEKAGGVRVSHEDVNPATRAIEARHLRVALRDEPDEWFVGRAGQERRGRLITGWSLVRIRVGPPSRADSTTGCPDPKDTTTERRNPYGAKRPSFR